VPIPRAAGADEVNNRSIVSALAAVERNALQGRQARLAGAGEPPVTAAQGCGVMAVIEAGERSAAEGRIVLPDFTSAERRAWAEFESKNRSAVPSVDR